MNGQWMDWLAVSAVVAVAAIWLILFYRRKWRRKKDPNAAGGCDGTCDGCRYSKDCCLKTRKPS